MKIITTYLLKEFLRILWLTVAGFVLVYLVVDFIEKIDNFWEAGVSTTRALLFFALSIPNILLYIMPVAVLVSVLISLGLLARHSEVVALKAGGVSLWRLSRPILLTAFAISVILFLISETVLPFTSSRANAIWEIEVEKTRAPSGDVHHNVWFRDSTGIYHFQVYDAKQKTIEGASVFLFGEKFSLLMRLEAERGHMEKGKWVFENGMLKTYIPGGTIDVRQFKRERFPLPEIPEDLGLQEKSSQEMNTRQLSQWIDNMKAGGYDPIRYLVDLQLKFSFPFICVIMAVIGLPIALWKEKGGGIALGIGVGIGLSFVYLVFLGLSRSLGYSGLLPPFAAAWLTNIFFTILGLFLFSYVKQ